jgi:hypothetical protein
VEVKFLWVREVEHRRGIGSRLLAAAGEFPGYPVGGTQISLRKALG